MRDRPILFSAPMVLALLEGRKTQTRRVAKLQPRTRADIGHYGLGMPFIRNPDPLRRNVDSPYGHPGDRMWVRETWRVTEDGGQPEPGGSTYCIIKYRADDAQATYGLGDDLAPYYADNGRWRSSIHMPRWASRITLEVTHVRVERLQAITEADAVAEGVEYERPIDPRDAFRRLWWSIDGAESWNANPWVWVVEFKRVTL